MGFWSELIKEIKKTGKTDTDPYERKASLYEQHRDAFSVYLEKALGDFRHELEYHDRIGDLNENSRGDAVEKTSLNLIEYFKQAEILQKAHTEDFLKLILHLLLPDRKRSFVVQSDRDKLFRALLVELDKKIQYYDGELDKVYYKMVNNFSGTFLGYTPEEILTRFDSSRLIQKAGGSSHPQSYRQIARHFEIHGIFDEFLFEEFVKYPKLTRTISWTLFVSAWVFWVYSTMSAEFSLKEFWDSISEVPGKWAVLTRLLEITGLSPGFLFQSFFAMSVVYFLLNWISYVKKKSLKNKMLKNFRNLIEASQTPAPYLKKSLEKIFPKADAELLRQFCKKARVRI